MQSKVSLVGLCFWALCFCLAPMVSCQESQKEKSSELDPEEIRTLHNGASMAFHKGQYSEAFQSVQKLCKQKPKLMRYQLLNGEISFAAGEMDACVAAYDAAIEMDDSIEPRLWQRGLALYYADRFADGVKQFETHQTVNSQDVENAVWHLLCAARVADLETARKKLIPIQQDTRIPMAKIYEMFAGRAKPEDVIKEANKTSKQVKEGSMSHRLQQYYAHLYIGLYQEMLGKEKMCKQSLEKAIACNPLGNTNFMGQVARVHLELRNKAK